VGRFTALETDDAAAVAARFGLGAVLRLAAIDAGTINSNFIVDTDDGRYFLRINEGKQRDAVAWEATLVERLAAGGVPTPVPLALADGSGDRFAAWRDKWISVFPWRDGRHLAPAEVTPAHAAALGRALAQLHVAGLAIPPADRRPSRYSVDELERRLAAIAAAAAASGDPALREVVPVLCDERDVLAAAAGERAAATHGIIHGDLFRDNVLWVGDRIEAVLDFEQASAGSLAYDLAVAIADWTWVDGPIANLASALVAGYQDVRPLAGADLMALPIEVRAAAWRFTITRLTDVYLPRIDNPEKDFREFFRRLLAWRTRPLTVRT
jgi:homoserine kinase type II